jgi:sulfhydrogenase subunit beta (sulfur reductase)
MTDKVISKTELRTWLASLLANYQVVAPAAADSGPARWKDIDANTEVDVTGNGMLMAVKEYLLPPYETLFTVNGKKGEEKIESGARPLAPDTRHPSLMIGLRLCDARAISVLDSVYLHGQFADPYYAARRENLVTMATVCDDPRWSCFCTSVGDLNEWAKAVDAMITDLSDKLYVAPISETGEKLTQGSFFSAPTPEETAKKDQVWTKLLALPKRPFAGKDLSKDLNWDDPVWAEIAKKCVGCGICSYMCPSCSCFDMQDETTGSTIERYRCRDTCQSCDFTMMGHGHNPRPEKTMRARQRVMHKFKYQMEQFSTLGCTGCGRCVESCPVNVDLRDVLGRITGMRNEG